MSATSTVKSSNSLSGVSGNLGRYAFLSRMVGMAVYYVHKPGKTPPTKGVIMGCWTSESAEPQFAVLGLDGQISFVSVTDVRFYHAEAIVQDSFEDTVDTIAANEDRRTSGRKYRASKTKPGVKPTSVASDRNPPNLD